ncbi:hypothetical protein G0Q06_08320 [Puniceicoccales bacterium CK1056]|uniref:Glycosyltransferase RgtA/B/C/D-like domain-containing protein n=1 Tax=Oceanipulchritudo coccoides TaxID=2706888 RepID=A0A6B2M0G8_9BACT|nr:hypothetical protein [Oceanipulchritudo coccoides]NDV62451.1 hypothetical protein [Oceanipulchritudo coccoides]
MRGLFVVVIGYIILFGIQYSFDALAHAPQLDAQENLVIAQAIKDSSLEPEPFYRALLYPYILGLFDAGDHPMRGLFFGLICHLLCGWLVSRIALSLWESRQLGTLSGLLYLINPVSLFFAVQLLDVTLSITLFLGGLALAMSRRIDFWTILLSGLFMGLAVITRPHFLPLALAMPVILMLRQSRLAPRWLTMWVPLGAILLIQGILNFQHSAEFRVLPWQGAYNLWAANKPSANGLYYKQSVDMSQRGSVRNPAKAESVYLYGQAHPAEEPPYSIDKMNAYWRELFVDQVKTSPTQVLRLWVFKAYATANAFEQYNNLTFSFHKARLPLLNYNPINWGILFVFASLGLMQLYRKDPRSATTMTLIIMAYASVLILFYASARFRLPLVPLMAVLAVGSLPWFRNLLDEKSRLVITVGVVLVSGGLAFSSFGEIRNTDTFIQDKLLLANANAEVNNDLEAAKWARQVLQESPNRLEAQRIYAISYFNLRLTNSKGWKVFGTWDEQKDWVNPGSTQDADLATILAFYKWHWGEQETATRIWQQVSKSQASAPSLAGLTLSVLNTKENALTPKQLTIKTLLSED